MIITLFVFFFQAEDGIRDLIVTGVQTCALSDLGATLAAAEELRRIHAQTPAPGARPQPSATAKAQALATARGVDLAQVRARGTTIREIGRASCRERV